MVNTTISLPARLRTVNLKILFAFTVILSLQAHSQTSFDGCYGTIEHDIEEQAVIFAKTYTPKPPFSQKQFYNNWTRGFITYEEGNRTNDVLISYNGWLDELMWLREKDLQSGVVAKANIAGFTFLWRDNSPDEEFRKVWVSGIVSGHFFLQVLTEGDYTLYCYRRVMYLVGKQDFVQSYQYYLETNGRLQSFKPNWLRVVLMFPKDERRTIRQIIRSNHLSVRKEKDLVRFFSILNQKTGSAGN